MEKKLYLIDPKWGLGKIEECEVVKETEKTYTIRRNGWGNHLVRKSEMRVWDYVLCKSYDEAVEKTKEFLANGIEENKTIYVNDPGGFASLTSDIQGCLNCGCVYLVRIPRKQNPYKTGKEYKNEKW